MKIHFLYATETGTSEMLCEDMADELEAGFDTEISNMGMVSPTDLSADTFYVFVTSTYGNGDLPSTALPFWNELEAAKTDLSHVSFAIFGLGDMVFDVTFNHGSKQVMDLLTECGAKQVGERGLFDASSPDLPEDIGLPWLHSIMGMLKEKAA